MNISSLFRDSNTVALTLTLEDLEFMSATENGSECLLDDDDDDDSVAGGSSNDKVCTLSLRLSFHESSG